MSEIARCPVCGKDPEVWCRDEEIRIRIVCCKHAAYSTPGWNQYAAAMEYSICDAWFDEIATLSGEMWDVWLDGSDKWVELDALEDCAIEERRAAWVKRKEAFK